MISILVAVGVVFAAGAYVGGRLEERRRLARWSAPPGSSTPALSVGEADPEWCPPTLPPRADDVTIDAQLRGLACIIEQDRERITLLEQKLSVLCGDVRAIEGGRGG